MTIHIDETAQHAVYAPSSAHRWTVCTASAEALAAMHRVVPDEEGDEAKEGTAAHDEIERCFGLTDGVADWRTIVDPEHPAAYGVALVMHYVQQLQSLFPGTLWIEQRVRLTEQIWGRCDVAHWHAESSTLTIVDYKNGFVDVDPVENEQLRIYAAASIYTHNLPAKWIRYVVVQPNSFMPVPRVKPWDEGVDSLLAFAAKVAAIPRGPLKFVGVGEHCRDCPLFGTCEPSKDVLVHLGAMLARPATDVSAEQLAVFMACKKPIEHYFEALWKHGTKMAISGTVPPGMKLVTTKTNREWVDEQAAREAIIAEKGIAVLKPPTVAQAEDMGIDVSELSRKPDGGPALAFESDKRKPWAAKSAAEMFKGVV